MSSFNKSTYYMMKALFLLLAGLFIFSACNENSGIIDSEDGLEIESANSQAIMLDPQAEYSFDGPMYDIAALPSGAILAADFATIKEIGRNGVRNITTLPMIDGPGPNESIATTAVNGLEPIGNGNFFATRSGLDLSVGAALFRATGGNARIVGDIESFTLGSWTEGDGKDSAGQAPSWKNFNCELPSGFSASPQTNPYHLTALSGSEVLIADAAANSILYAKTDGNIELVATLPPVMDPATGEPIVQFPLNEDTDCFVEPVPTSVSIGADGDYYVSELNGTHPANFAGEPTPEGLSSVWRIEYGSRNVECPSDKCEKVLTGLNSVTDAEFGPDGYLYVVEYEQNGFLATVAPGLEIPLAGGAIKKCDVEANECEVIEGGDGSLYFPGAITFDKWGNPWMIDNVFEPTVRRVAMN